MEERNEYNRIDRVPINPQVIKPSIPIWLKIIVMLLMFMLLTSFAALIQQSRNVNDLKSTVTFLESQNGTIQAQYATQEAENLSLQEHIETLETENQYLKEQVTSLELEIDNIRGTPEP